MAKGITSTELRKICIEINNWPVKASFGWNEICQKSENILGYRPSRQALSNKPIIKKSYRDKSREFRALARKLGGLKSESKLSSAIRNDVLLAENKALLDQLSAQAELMNRMIYNATRLGIKKDQLLAALPKLYK
jgi:hypothetical protein